MLSLGFREKRIKRRLTRKHTLTGEWCCEYCYPTECFNTCGELATHIKQYHPDVTFPNCCNSNADCITLYGSGYVCQDGVCVKPIETYPMVIAAEAILEGNPAVDIQIQFTISEVSKYTPYADSLAEGRYNFVFPETITHEGKTYTLLGNNSFYIDHPLQIPPGATETYFKASYFSYLPPPPIRVRFNATDPCLVDWGEGPQEYGSMLVAPGSNVTVKALSCEGYNFAFWRKNDVEVGTANPRTFTITEDETKIDALFEEVKVPTPPPTIPTPSIPEDWKHVEEIPLYPREFVQAAQLDGEKKVTKLFKAKTNKLLGIYVSYSITYIRGGGPPLIPQNKIEYELYLNHNKIHSGNIDKEATATGSILLDSTALNPNSQLNQMTYIHYNNLGGWSDSVAQIVLHIGYESNPGPVCLFPKILEPVPFIRKNQWTLRPEAPIFCTLFNTISTPRFPEIREKLPTLPEQKELDLTEKKKSTYRLTA